MLSRTCRGGLGSPALPTSPLEITHGISRRGRHLPVPPKEDRGGGLSKSNLDERSSGYEAESLLSVPIVSQHGSVYTTILKRQTLATIFKALTALRRSSKRHGVPPLTAIEPRHYCGHSRTDRTGHPAVEVSIADFFDRVTCRGLAGMSPVHQRDATRNSARRTRLRRPRCCAGQKQAMHVVSSLACDTGQRTCVSLGRSGFVLFYEP